MASLRRRGRRASSTALWAGIATIIVLWALTMVVSDESALIITGFWFIAGSVIVLWVRKDLGADRRGLDAIAAGLESALRRNLADVYDIRSTEFVEFEEIEDEGACYAFELQNKSGIVFLSGQEFYETVRFPSLDFALVFPLDEADRRVEMLIEKRAAKAAPGRRIPARVKRTLIFPEDLEIVAGTLPNLEESLSGRRD